jgi:hypothetical protein
MAELTRDHATLSSLPSLVSANSAALTELGSMCKRVIEGVQGMWEFMQQEANERKAAAAGTSLTAEQITTAVTAQLHNMLTQHTEQLQVMQASYSRERQVVKVTVADAQTSPVAALTTHQPRLSPADNPAPGNAVHILQQQHQVQHRRSVVVRRSITTTVVFEEQHEEEEEEVQHMAQVLTVTGKHPRHAGGTPAAASADDGKTAHDTPVLVTTTKKRGRSATRKEQPLATAAPAKVAGRGGPRATAATPAAQVSPDVSEPAPPEQQVGVTTRRGRATRAASASPAPKAPRVCPSIPARKRQAPARYAGTDYAAGTTAGIDDAAPATATAAATAAAAPTKPAAQSQPRRGRSTPAKPPAGLPLASSVVPNVPALAVSQLLFSEGVPPTHKTASQGPAASGKRSLLTSNRPSASLRAPAAQQYASGAGTGATGSGNQGRKHAATGKAGSAPTAVVNQQHLYALGMGSAVVQQQHHDSQVPIYDRDAAPTGRAQPAGAGASAGHYQGSNSGHGRGGVTEPIDLTGEGAWAEDVLPGADTAAEDHGQDDTSAVGLDEELRAQVEARMKKHRSRRLRNML